MFGLLDIYNAAIAEWHEFEAMWKWHEAHDPEFEKLIKFAGETAFLDTLDPSNDWEPIYGWDSAMTVGRALHEYDIQYNLSDILHEDLDTLSVTTRLQHILKNQGNGSFWFLGMSGNVSFKKTGDRRHGYVLQCLF